MYILMCSLSSQGFIEILILILTESIGLLQNLVQTFDRYNNQITKMQTVICASQKSSQFQRKRKLSGFSQTTESTDDENNCERLNMAGKGRKCLEKKQIKYKTELCKNFSETGSCPYRRKCKFAHGPTELNIANKQQGKYYRTKKCNSFWMDGACSYGQRCQFMHIRVEHDTARFLDSWKVAIQMQTNESGFAGSKLLRLLRIE